MKLHDIYVAINMTNEDWATSTSAPTMLAGLYLQDPVQFKSYTSVLHRYFIACCWKRKFLIPQEDLRNGLRAAERWIDGEITDEEFWRLEWYAEAEAFAFENVETTEEENALKVMISNIKELKGFSYELACDVLKEAAYFTNSAMVYPTTNTAPYNESLCTSRFLCPDLLREHLEPRIEKVLRNGDLDLVEKN